MAHTISCKNITLDQDTNHPSFNTLLHVRHEASGGEAILAMVRLATPNNGDDHAEILVGGNRGLILRTFTDDVDTLNNQNIFMQPAGSTALLCQHQNVFVTGTFHNNSDSPLEDHQQEVQEETALGVLRAVSPKTYLRNDLDGKPSRVGFIAQDIQSAIPQQWTNLVGECENDAGRKIKGLDYARLTSVLWSVCKNLDARVKQLESAQ